MITYNVLDFDQTLFYTRNALVSAYLEAFKLGGYILDPKLLIENEGKSIDVLFEQLSIPVSNRNEIKKLKRNIYSEYYPLIVPNYQLLALDNKVIVSNASQVDIERITNYFNIHDVLSIYGRERIGRLKPYPDGFLKCFKDFGISNHYCIYDDQDWGLLSAKQAAEMLSMLNQVTLIKVNMDSNTMSASQV